MLKATEDEKGNSVNYVLHKSGEQKTFNERVLIRVDMLIL